MTPTEFKRCRHTLRLTQSELARLLRLSGNGDRSIRHYEAGTKPVPGPVSVVLDMLCNDHNPLRSASGLHMAVIRAAIRDLDA